MYISSCINTYHRLSSHIVSWLALDIILMLPYQLPLWNSIMEQLCVQSMLVSQEIDSQLYKQVWGVAQSLSNACLLTLKLERLVIPQCSTCLRSSRSMLERPNGILVHSPSSDSESSQVTRMLTTSCRLHQTLHAPWKWIRKTPDKWMKCSSWWVNQCDTMLLAHPRQPRVK